MSPTERRTASDECAGVFACACACVLHVRVRVRVRVRMLILSLLANMYMKVDDGAGARGNFYVAVHE